MASVDVPIPRPRAVSDESPTTTSDAAVDKAIEHSTPADALTSEKNHTDTIPPPSESSEPPAMPPIEPIRTGETMSAGKIALIMFALGMAVFLAALDMTIMSTALPTISASFATSQADYTWIVSSYLLAAAAATPTWGKVSDIFGRKPMLLTANVVFFVGSVIAGWSSSTKMLIGGRVVQGIGCGGLFILVNICISDLFSMRSRGAYFGIIGMVWALASAVGPVFGGVFTEYATWRWCFWINLPCDGIAFLLLLFFLDIETPTTPLVEGLKAIDWLGSLFVVGGTVMFLYGLEIGGISSPWNSAEVICLIVFGVVAWILFFLVEWKVAKYPLIPLRLFEHRSNVAALGTCFIHGFVFIAGAYYLPLYFQAVLGATPLLSGVYTFAYVISLSLVSAVTGIYIKKTGKYLPPIVFGMFFMTVGFGLFINLPAYASWPRIIIFQIIAGLGTGPNFQAPLIALQSLIRGPDIAAATATFGFTRNLATSISVVIGGVIFQNQMSKKYVTLAAVLPPGLAATLSSGSAGANTAIVAALPAALRTTTVEAYTASLQSMWIFYTVICFLGLCVSLAITQNVLNIKREHHHTGLAGQEKARLEREEARRLQQMSKSDAAAKI